MAQGNINNTNASLSPGRGKTFGVAYPISAGKALKYLSEQLTDYEKGETLDYNNIYFIGENSEKIKGVPQGGYNYGYDDEKEDYNVVMNDHIAYRYQVVGTLGKGSFGQVNIYMMILNRP